MIYLWPLISALIPILALIVYIYWCDKHSPEPISQLIKATMYGVLSIFLSLCMSIPAQYMGLYPEDPANFIDGIRTAFYGAAIPEELAKLAMLWLLLRKKTFQHRLDGIVYAVCISLGFAGLENILYVVANSRAYYPENLNEGMASWKKIMYGADVVVGLLCLLIAMKAFKKKA